MLNLYSYNTLLFMPFIWKRLSVNRQLQRDIDHDHVDSCKTSTGKTGSLSFAIYYDYINFIYVACEVGDTGPNYTTRCLYPAYGQGCQSVCKCTKKDCNYVYGCKTQQETYVLGMLFALHAKTINRIQRYISM